MCFCTVIYCGYLTGFLSYTCGFEARSVRIKRVCTDQNCFSADLILIQEYYHIIIYTHNKLLSCFVAVFQE